jgi:hypothetical protein
VNAANGVAQPRRSHVKYLLTIYGDESQHADRTEEEGRRMMAAYDAFTAEARESGALVAAEGLQPVSTATTVRVRDGERSITDGPFAETKEQLGGFYLLECSDLDEAIDWAARIPSVAVGFSVEVRPVMDYEAAGSTEHDRTAATRA